MERKIPKSTMSSIRAKLISAVAMLLVAVTMVVSSTYAWFTLSTAPEVSGITTAIGANGALEIRLNTTNTNDENSTPGNIVDLSSTTYGLNKVTLMPSQLVTIDLTGGKKQIPSNILSIPQYKANGRLELVTDEKTQTGVYDFTVGNFFAPEEETYGVRAVGVSSGLTDRQYAYRNAKSAASTNATLAQNEAAVVLNSKGNVLGEIVIKKVESASSTYTQAEVNAIKEMINSLEQAIAYIETAYEEMLVAYAASGVEIDGNELPDQAYLGLRAAFEGTLTLQSIVDADGQISITYGEGDNAYSGSVTLPEAYLTPISNLMTTKANVTAAENALPAEKDSYGWSDLSGTLNYLINLSTPGAVKLNEYNVNEVTEDQLGNIATSIMNKGVNIYLNEGSGVFEEIADHCGNFEASVTMQNVVVKGVPFETLNAKMITNSETPTVKYLAAMSEAISLLGEPSGNSDVALPMTEFYGFILDLEFKTNASSSNLLLQTEAVDRIYKDNENEATQGKGSYMTYKATTSELTTEQVKNLMNCIRIVFFNTDSSEIIGEARLDTANAAIGADGVTAKMYMYIDSTDDGVDNGVLQNGTDTNNSTAIQALAQNKESKISVLVYLDGETIKNGDVAATAATSVTGMMNIQFASDANLIPMEYGDLHTPNKDTTTTTTTNP